MKVEEPEEVKKVRLRIRQKCEAFRKAVHAVKPRATSDIRYR